MDGSYDVVAVDFPGHGKSDGLRGYVSSADDLVEDGAAIVEYAYQSYKDSNTSLVLCGSSMGGAIAVAVADRLKSKGLGGGTTETILKTEPLLILLAPMLQLNVSGLERMALRGLAAVAPTAQLIPSAATDAAKQYRDPAKRKECEEDSLTVAGSKLRVGSALACVDMTLMVQSMTSTVTSPYLLMIADEDVVVKNEGAEKFFADTQRCEDKTKKNYKALHGLLCEPSPLFDEIKNEILQWIHTRVDPQKII